MPVRLEFGGFTHKAPLHSSGASWLGQSPNTRFMMCHDVPSGGPRTDLPKTITDRRGNFNRLSVFAPPPCRQFLSRALFVCLCLWLAVIATSTAQAQALTNGGNQDGTLAVGTTNAYTVAANAGDRVVLQVAKSLGGAAFTPLLEFFAPDGTR